MSCRRTYVLNNYKSIPVDLNKDENAHRFALSGELLERENESERERRREKKRERERKRGNEKERERERATNNK